VIVVTGFGSMETVIAAIRAGAYDFITKPIQMDDLALTLSRAVQLRNLRQEVKRLRSEVATTKTFEEIVGTSPAVRAVYYLVERVADSDTTVLITGESGTGKELVARALHRRGRRSTGPFVAITTARRCPNRSWRASCSGHVRGALHRCEGVESGSVRQGQRGHAVPRRDRRNGRSECRSNCCARARANGPPGRR